MPTAFTPGAVGGAAQCIALKQTIIWGPAPERSSPTRPALGSAAIAHAAADTKGPVQQGLYGIFEVFADTIVICTLTAMTIICSGVDIPFRRIRQLRTDRKRICNGFWHEIRL